MNQSTSGVEAKSRKTVSWLDKFNARLLFLVTPEYGTDYIQSYSGHIGPITTWFKQYPESLASVDPKLAEIDVPVLIFWGAQDQLLLVENAERLHQRLRRSKLHIFDNCGTTPTRISIRSFAA